MEVEADHFVFNMEVFLSKFLPSVVLKKVGKIEDEEENKKTNTRPLQPKPNISSQ